MLSFSYFVHSFLRKINNCDVFGKHREKITISFNFHTLNALQHLRLRGVYLELRV